MHVTSRPLLPVLVAGSVVLVSLGAVACGEEKVPVALGSVSRASVAELVDAPATVTARAAATLSAPADGLLTDLRVDPGDTVTEGQILAVIDSPTARDRLKQAEQALDAAERAGRGTGGGIRKAELTRSRRATDQAAARAFATARDAAGKITEPALRDAQLSQVRAAEQQYALAARAADQAVRATQRGVAQLGAAVGALGSAQQLQAQQAYDLAKSTVDALTLRAPVGGVVQWGGTADGTGTGDALTGLLGAAGIGGAGGTTVGVGPVVRRQAAGPAAPGTDGAVAVGGRVSAGTPILTVVDLAELGLVAEVDETEVLTVTLGLTATVELDAATGATYDARVRAVDVLPAAGARAGVGYRVRLALADGRYPDGRPAPAPRPGMSALVHLRVRQADDAVTVPAAAVFSTEGRDNVWLVQSGRAVQIPVTVGVQGAELVQILDGVEPGQRLVVRGTDRIRTGQQLP